MLTLNTIEPDHHELVRDGRPVGVLRVDLATATRIVALLNLAAWVEAGDEDWRDVNVGRAHDGIPAPVWVACDTADGQVFGRGATLDEALADLGELR